MAVRYVKDFEFPSAAGYSKSSPSKVTGQMLAKGGKVEKEPKGMMVIIGVGKPKGPMRKAEGSNASDFDSAGYAGKGALEGAKYGAVSDRVRRMMKEDDNSYDDSYISSNSRTSSAGPNPRVADQIVDSMESAVNAVGRRLKGRHKPFTSVAYKKGGKVEKVMHEFGEGKLHSGSKKGPKVTNPKQAIAIALSEAGKAKKGYAEGGMKAEQGVALPSPEKEMFEVYDRQTGDVVGTYGSLKRASRAVDKRDNEYGGYRYAHRPVAKAKGGDVKSVPVKDIKSGKVPQSTDEDYYGKAKDAPMPPRRPSMLKKGGMPHEDVKEDTALIKSMVKPMALKKADGGGIGLASPRLASPLQQMGARPRGVPVAPRAPMIAQQAAPVAAGGPRIGVGRSRSGKPDVGAIRAAMARAATQAMPENAPSMMKKGGKVKC